MVDVVIEAMSGLGSVLGSGPRGDLRDEAMAFWGIVVHNPGRGVGLATRSQQGMQGSTRAWHKSVSTPRDITLKHPGPRSTTDPLPHWQSQDLVVLLAKLLLEIVDSLGIPTTCLRLGLGECNGRDRL